MRPSVTEQLEGLARILAEVIAPEVEAPYAAEMLGGVIGSLDSLKTAWATVPAFLLWDIASTEAVLAAALPVLAEDLFAEISALVADAAGDTLDWSALEIRQVRLRELLARAVPAILEHREDSNAYALMVELFRDRAERFPFSMSARPPAKKPAPTEK
jgi:hypothetical protein